MFGRVFVIFILVFSLTGCVPITSEWYKEYGIPAEVALTKKESIPKLIKALDDERPEVRGYAAERLGLFGPDAKDAIYKLYYVRTKDNSGSVRSFADTALIKIFDGPYDDYFKDQKTKHLLKLFVGEDENYLKEKETKLAKHDGEKDTKISETPRVKPAAKEKSTTPPELEKQDDEKALKKEITQKKEPAVQKVPVQERPASPKVTPSNYYALIIGNNNYRYLPQLKTAVHDARIVASALENFYGFKTKLVLDATRRDIVNALNLYRETMSPADNLLIYYAGHGTYDKVAGRAYWLPVDAKEDMDTEWIIVDTITSNLKRMQAKHILIVADSCYAGTLTRRMIPKLKTEDERTKFLEKIQDKKSRTLLASGGNEPVADSGGGKHSVFAKAFLKGLHEMENKVFTAEELYLFSIKEQVAGKSAQMPEYHTIRNSGHDGGDFCFIRK